jgi:DnaJ-class molecular chaperone
LEPFSDDRDALTLDVGRHEGSIMTAKIKEHICKACNGTGFPNVKQPVLAARKIYPVKCGACSGKGRIADMD